MRMPNLRVLILVTAILFAAGLGFFAALGVRSVLAGPGSAPAAQPPAVSHSYDQIVLPGGTWPNLDADKLDGMHAGQTGTDYVCHANASGNVGIGTATPDKRLHVSGTIKAEGGVETSIQGYNNSVSEWAPAIYGRNEGAGDGVYGVAQDRAGVFGVGGDYGVHGEATVTGVHGEGTVYGVHGEGDFFGVYGQSSGVLSTAVWGQNTYEGNEGRLGYYDGGVYGSGSPAAYFEGDLKVTGAYRGNIGPNNGAPFPRPAYDSGWVSIAQGENVGRLHDLGGNVDDYFIDFQCKDPGYRINNMYVGGNSYYQDEPFPDFVSEGAYYHGVTWNAIQVHRNSWDPVCEEFRVRMWVVN
jgi:hypothetical protein